METEQYGYEIYALKRSFGSLKGNLEFPMEIKGSKWMRSSKDLKNYLQIYIQSSKSVNMQ